MRSMLRIVAFVMMGLLLALPLLGHDVKDKAADAKMPPPKKGMKNMDRDPEAAKEKALRSSVIRAKVMAVIEDKKTVRLQLTVPYVKVNNGAVQNYYNAQMSMLRATNPQAMYNAQVQMAQAEAQIYQLATTTKDVEWQATDDVKVRMLNPPAQFDDKGRIKKYTKKELKELKGDDKKKLGYPGEFSDLKQDQIVEVTIVKKKDAPCAAPKRGKGKDADPELLPDNLPQISMVMILVEPKN